MKILVIGYGSIGRRHSANLKAAGHDVILLRHSNDSPNKEAFREYYSFRDAVVHEKIDGAIVSSPTSRHLSDVELLIQQQIPFLLEKPPAIDLESTILMQQILQKNDFSSYEIGFNMRYYPAICFIRDFLPQLGHIYASRIAAGAYLPDWRKGIDYRMTFSASRELGGGILELVHEIDYSLWFFGLPEKVAGYISRISNLDISTDDICAAILTYHDGSVIEMHLDYLSHKSLRSCQIIAENGTLEWEMVSGTVLFTQRGMKTGKEIFRVNEGYDINETYIAELQNFINIIKGCSQSKVSITESISTMKVVEAIKTSSKTEKWVSIHI